MGGLGGRGDVWTCVCERGSVLEGPGKEVLGKGTKEGTCSLFDAGEKRAREGNAREGTKEGTCSPFDAVGNCVQGRGVKVFANVSAGADTKANTLGVAAHLSSEILVSLRTAASLAFFVMIMVASFSFGTADSGPLQG